MIGAAGRVYIGGTTDAVIGARDAIVEVLNAVDGRE
jgi:hypothetical protein